MKHLDLFSGIGGFSLAARNVGWDTIQFVEIDPYCQKVLKKNFPGVPIHSDIKDYEGEKCDIITGGFPCQPYSVAGKQRGARDDRALWPELVRIISLSGPSWFVGENVTGFIEVGLNSAIDDLGAIGYAVQSFVIPACAVNAIHRRDRVWIVAHSDRAGLQGVENAGIPKESWAEPQEHPARLLERERRLAIPAGKCGGVHDGIPNRMDRLRGLGNAIVPQVAEVTFHAIQEVETQAMRIRGAS